MALGSGEVFAGFRFKDVHIANYLDSGHASPMDRFFASVTSAALNFLHLKSGDGYVAVVYENF